MAAIPVSQQAPVEVSAEDKGKRIFARCRACHTLPEGGKNRVGPNLWNIIGRTAGSAEGYAYSKAMKTSEVVWSEEALSAYLEKPSAYMPKNKMAFAGLRKQADRDNLIAYLKANTESQ
ncbi:MAG: cytochrome c family protein [Robiginitomaculum sp.]|nr:MAG: cytochrome c family protein [Robiginitomaculum sp.]